MLSQKTNAGIRQTKCENADETRKRLELLFHRSFNPEGLDDVALDRRETARFIADKTRILRLATNAAGLRTLTWMIENAFYEAYSNAQSKKTEAVEFVSSSANLQ